MIPMSALRFGKPYIRLNPAGLVAVAGGATVDVY